MLSDWTNLLGQTLARLRTNRLPCLAVMGVGQEFRGDDAAGLMVARALKPVFAAREDILVVEGGHAPENHTGLLRYFAPNWILLVDAACMGVSPGAVRCLTAQEIGGLSASTHTIPLSVIAHFLSAELACEVAFLGIQPGQTSIGAGLSPPVKQAVDDIVAVLTLLIGGF